MDISPDVLKILEIYTSQLSKALISKEKALSSCSKEIQREVSDGIKLIKLKKYDEAVKKFLYVIKKEPKYTRVRLQLIDLHKKNGNHVTAIFLGGNALAYATENRTKCQIMCLVADAAARMYSHHNDPIEYDAAKQFYNNAIEFDETDPVPQWNLIELMYKNKDYFEAKIQLDEMIKVVEKSGGCNRKYIERVIDDAKNTFPDSQPWIDYVRRLEDANSMFVSEEDQTEYSQSTRKALVAAALIAMFATTTYVSESQASLHETSVTQNSYSTQKENSEVSSYEFFPLINSEDNDQIQLTTVDYDPEDLSAIEYDPLDLT